MRSARKKRMKPERALATTGVLLVILTQIRTDAMLLSMLLGRRRPSIFPKPIIKVYRDFDMDKGLRSGIKLGIDASFGHKHKHHHKEPSHHHLHHQHDGSQQHEHYDDRGLGVKFYDEHDDYKLQQGDYDLHRYQKSPSITFEIKAPEEGTNKYRSIFKTSYPRESLHPTSSYNVRKLRRRKPRPRPQVAMPTYRKELMFPSYKFGPYKGHSLMGFTYDNSEKEMYSKS